MRILASLFHPSGSWLFSGSERRFCALTEKWQASGHEIWALEPRPFAADSMVAGYQPVSVSVRGSNLGSQLFSWYLRAVSEGIATARRVGVDLIYATNNNVFNLLVAGALARRLSLPCVVVVHHLRWVTYDEDAAARPTGRYAPLAFLNALAREGMPVGGAIGRVAGAQLESQLLPTFDGFLTVSDAVRGQLVGWLPEDHVFTVGNGLHPPPRSESHVGERPKAGLYVGRLDEGKGTLDLIRVWEEVLRLSPDARLDIVGDGSLRKRLEERASRPDLVNRVRFRGFLPERDLRDLRHTSRLFLTLSRTEGFGIALAEALADGLPVVAWDIPPLREIWGKCGAVSFCPTGDIEAVRKAVVDVLEAPPERWELLSYEASRYVQRFSWDEVAAKELRILGELVGRR